jgi:hypothetical protein
MSILDFSTIKRVKITAYKLHDSASGYSALKKIVFNKKTVYEDDSVYFSLSEPYYKKLSIYYSVDKGTTWAGFVSGNRILESGYGGSCGYSNGNRIIYKLPETDDRSDNCDFWVVKSLPSDTSNKKTWVLATDEIEAGTYYLLIRAKTSISESGEVIVGLGVNDIDVSSEGTLCVFAAPQAGEYCIYSTSENADLGREMNGEFEYFEDLPHIVTLNQGEELRILCATKNWQNDSYDLIITQNE